MQGGFATGACASPDEATSKNSLEEGWVNERGIGGMEERVGKEGKKERKGRVP